VQVTDRSQVRHQARRYDDPCGIARALNVVGERWALLVVRELVFGPKRFSDLRRDLGAVSPNVLSQRLDDLERQQIVRRSMMGPPVSAPVYQLTEHGQGLLPVLDALAGWGSHLPLDSDRELSRDALLFALRSTVRGDVIDAPPVRITLHGISWDAAIEHGELQWRTVAGPARATLDTEPAVLRALIFGGLALDQAVADGSASVAGAPGDVRTFIAAFARPGQSPRADARTGEPS
jgi:DNA-binding HxlR family transcriptional regulator